MRTFKLISAEHEVDTGAEEPVFHEERQGWTWGGEVLSDPERAYLVTFEDAPDPAPAEAYVWGPIDWLNTRWLPLERVAVRQLAKTNPIVEDFVRTLDDPRTLQVITSNEGVAQGVGYLATLDAPTPFAIAGRGGKVLTPTRVTEILAPRDTAP